jgi:WD40 repeat protein
MAGLSYGTVVVAFGTDPHGRLLLASGSDAKTVLLWDPLDAASDGKQLNGHTLSVTSVAFGTTSEGKLLLASGSYDGTARLWDPVKEGCIVVLRRRTGVRSIAVIGSLVAIGDQEGVSILDVPINDDGLAITLVN